MSFLRRKGMHKNCLLLKHSGPIKNFWVIKFFVFSAGFYKIIIADSLACLSVTELNHYVLKETSRSFSFRHVAKVSIFGNSLLSYCHSIKSIQYLRAVFLTCFSVIYVLMTMI